MNWEIHDAADLAGFNLRIIGVARGLTIKSPKPARPMRSWPRFIEQTKTKSPQLVTSSRGIRRASSRGLTGIQFAG